MATMRFTSHLRKVAPGGDVEVNGPTVAAALEQAFAAAPKLRGYVLDDQGRLRKHVVIYLDGERQPPDCLSVPVAPQSDIYVLQALSGG